MPFKTDQSKALHDRSCKSLVLGVSTVFRHKVTPVPLFMERGNGPYYYDVDGHELLDYTLAWGPLIVGNNHPKLTEAITRQLASAYTYGAQHAGEIELAESIVNVLPDVERVIFSNTGTEAVQSALRIARAYTGRDKIIKFEGHYHGWLNNVLVNVHPTAEQLGKPSVSCGGQPEEEFAHTIILPWNDLDALAKTFEDFGGQIACVLTEPINVNSGSCMPDPGYLPGLIDLCRKHGTLSIFDEVITGFRIALGGAREYYGLDPDLSIYAKAMAGGFSMAAVASRGEIFDVLSDGRTMHAGTYNGNPICTAASTATIQILSEPGLFERMHAHGDTIRQTIEQAAVKCGHQLVTSGTGTCFNVHFGLADPPRQWTDVMKADEEKGNRFRSAMLGHQVQTLPEGRWYVGATHTDKELGRVVPAIEQSMKEIG